MSEIAADDGLSHASEFFCLGDELVLALTGQRVYVGSQYPSDVDVISKRGITQEYPPLGSPVRRYEDIHLVDRIVTGVTVATTR